MHNYTYIGSFTVAIGMHNYTYIGSLQTPPKSKVEQSQKSFFNTLFIPPSRFDEATTLFISDQKILQSRIPGDVTAPQTCNHQET